MQTLSALMLAAALFAAGTALAQDTAAPEAETETEAQPEAEAAPEAVTDAPADTDAAAEGLPPNLEITEYQDWEVRCDTENGNCFMYQLARDGNDNPVSEITLVPLPQGGEAVAGATVITPLGTLLSEGLVMQIDQGGARQYPFNWCTRTGCFARFGLTEGEISAMRAGAVARLRLVSVSAPEQPVVLELSLSGFTAAFNAVAESQN